MYAVTLMPHEIPVVETLERTVYAVGSFQLTHQNEAALLLARRLAVNGIGEGIRHDLVVYQDDRSDDGKRVMFSDLDSLAFTFSQDRNMTLYRHCLTFSRQTSGWKFEMDSIENHAFAKGLFMFVAPYYYCYLLDNLHGQSVNTMTSMKYVESMMSDAELKCFANSVKPVTVNTFVVR